MDLDAQSFNDIETQKRNGRIAKMKWYHTITKHKFTGYAASPGFLDWDSQPNPFRHYTGCKNTELTFVKTNPRRGGDTLDFFQRISLFMELAGGISAWKTTGMDSWALRNNPSSGNLHPTEFHFVLWDGVESKLIPGCYHYNVYQHSLELRCKLDPQVATKLRQALPGAIGAVALSSIIWREEWKYGSRAYRYCNLDVGHAIGSIYYAGLVCGF